MNYTLIPVYFKGDKYAGHPLLVCDWSCVKLSTFYVVVTMLATFGSNINKKKHAFTSLLHIALFYFLVKYKTYIVQDVSL